VSKTVLKTAKTRLSHLTLLISCYILLDLTVLTLKNKVLYDNSSKEGNTWERISSWLRQVKAKTEHYYRYIVLTRINYYIMYLCVTTRINYYIIESSS
jgi:hypothetical protein